MTRAVSSLETSLAADGRASLRQLVRGDLACVRNRDPAARTLIETLVTYPGVHAMIWHRLAHWLWARGFKFPARFLSWLGRFLSNVDIHPGARIGPRCFIDHGAGVVIGETAVVGADVTLYHGVTLGGTSWSPGRRHPTLEDGVLVGAGAKILGAITIGRGARVGAILHSCWLPEARPAPARERLRFADDLDPEQLAALPEELQTVVHEVAAELDAEQEERR